MKVDDSERGGHKETQEQETTEVFGTVNQRNHTIMAYCFCLE